MDAVAFAEKCLGRAYELLDAGPRHGEDEEGRSVDLDMTVARAEGLGVLAMSALNVGSFHEHKRSLENTPAKPFQPRDPGMGHH